jgi:hypothetical protein
MSNNQCNKDLDLLGGISIGRGRRRGWFSGFCFAEWSLAAVFFALTFVVVAISAGTTKGYDAENVRTAAHAFVATLGNNVTSDAAAIAPFGFGAYFDQYSGNAAFPPLAALTAKEEALAISNPPKFATWLAKRQADYEDDVAKAAAKQDKREVSLTAHVMSPSENGALVLGNLRLCRVFSNATAAPANLVTALDCLGAPASAGLPLQAALGAKSRGCTTVYSKGGAKDAGRGPKKCAALSTLAPLPAAPVGAAAAVLASVSADFYLRPFCYYLSFTTGAAPDPVLSYTAQLAGINADERRMTGAQYALMCEVPV